MPPDETARRSVLLTTAEPHASSPSPRPAPRGRRAHRVHHVEGEALGAMVDNGREGGVYGPRRFIGGTTATRPGAARRSTARPTARRRTRRIGAWWLGEGAPDGRWVEGADGCQGGSGMDGVGPDVGVADRHVLHSRGVLAGIACCRGASRVPPRADGCQPRRGPTARDRGGPCHLHPRRWGLDRGLLRSAAQARRRLLARSARARHRAMRRRGPGVAAKLAQAHARHDSSSARRAIPTPCSPWRSRSPSS